MKLTIMVIVASLITLHGCTVLGLCHCDYDHPYLGDNGACYSSESYCESENSGRSCYYCGN